MAEEYNDIYVRTATPEDEEAVMNLIRLNTEAGLFPINEEKVRALVKPSLYLHRGIIGVIGPRTRLEGLVILRLSEHWYSDEVFLEEMCFYVHPDYRSAKGGRGRKLMEFSKKTSEKMGIPLIIGILSNSRMTAKVRLYKRQFGDPVGEMFIYGIKQNGTAQQETVE